MSEKDEIPLIAIKAGCCERAWHDGFMVGQKVGWEKALAAMNGTPQAPAVVASAPPHRQGGRHD